MIGPRERQDLQQDVLLAQSKDDPLDLSRRPGQDDLVRTVVDRDADIGSTQLANHRLDAVPAGGDGHELRRRHLAGRFEAAEDRPEPAQLPFQLAIDTEHARGGQGQHLAAAVADHRVRTQAQTRQHLIQRPLGVEDDIHTRRRRPDLTAVTRPNE